MKKKGIIAICAILAVLVVGTALILTDNKGNISNVHRVVGYSARYDDNLIKEACRVVEQKFSEEFEGCTLTELRYDAEVENRFADEISRYAAENNQELIVLLSTFHTDKKGGDGSFNPNDTYTNWQWHLVRTEDTNSWEVIGCGY